MAFEVKRVEHEDASGRSGAGIALELPPGMDEEQIESAKASFVRAVSMMHAKLDIPIPYYPQDAKSDALKRSHDATSNIAMKVYYREHLIRMVTELEYERSTGGRLIYLKGGFDPKQEIRPLVSKVRKFLGQDRKFGTIMQGFRSKNWAGRIAGLLLKPFRPPIGVKR